MHRRIRFVAVRVLPFLEPRLVVDRPSVESASSLFVLLGKRAAPCGIGVDAATLTALLEERERQLCTATPERIAFPHAIDSRITRTVLGLVRLDPPLRFADDRPACDLAVVLIGSATEPWQHVRMLASVARLFARGSLRARLADAPHARGMVAAVRDAEADHN